MSQFQDLNRAHPDLKAENDALAKVSKNLEEMRAASNYHWMQTLISEHMIKRFKSDLIAESGPVEHKRKELDFIKK